MAFYHSIIQAINQSIKRSSNQATKQPINHSIIQSFNHSIIQSINRSSDQSFKRSSNQAIKQSSNQSSNQAIKQSSNQATLPYFYHFYQNRFKNPLLFIIPSIINPFINLHRNIFQPFDSISPIFKSVELTELNSKER